MENSTVKVPVMIYNEATPNPNTLKFVLNRIIYDKGSAEFNDKAATEKSDLAKILFDINGITSVFISGQFVTLGKEENLVWAELVPTIRQTLTTFFSNDDAKAIADDYVKPTHVASNEITTDDNEVVVKIKAALDKYVKPAVEMDGGNISFVSFNQGILTLQLQGSCSGCPSSSVTLKQGIENLLQKFVPEVKAVVAENE